jgi:hypothetical protein
MNNLTLLGMVGVAVVFLVVTTINPPTIFGWHEQLAGISDQKAAEMYQTNQNDPQIIRWKNSAQNTIDDFKSTCTGHWKVDYCIIYAREINFVCMSHPGNLLACSNPMISQMAAGKLNPNPNANFNKHEF